MTFIKTNHFKVLSNKAVEVLLVPCIQLETENMMSYVVLIPQSMVS